MAALILLAAGRILTNSWTNVVQKQLTNRRVRPLLIVAVSFLLLTLILIPVSLFISFEGLPPLFWVSVCLAALLDTPGNILLVKAVGEMDLSVFGPLNAYKPIIAMILGVLFLGEIPTWPGLLGLLVVFAGSLFLSTGDASTGFRAMAALFRDRGVRYRLLSLVMIAAAAIFLKAAINRADALRTLVIWVFASTPVAYVSWRWLSPARGDGVFSALRASPGKFLLLVLLFLAMQGCTLLLFSMMDVAYALAVFQLSAVVSVLFGYTVFRESHILLRATGAVIMCAGAVIILLAG